MTRFLCLAAGAVGLVRSGLCGVRVGRGELACGGRCSDAPHTTCKQKQPSSIEHRGSSIRSSVIQFPNRCVGLGPRLIERALINRKIVDRTPPCALALGLTVCEELRDAVRDGAVPRSACLYEYV